MKLRLEFEVERESYQEILDALDLLKKSINQDFLASYEELEKDDEENFAGKWVCSNYDMEIEL